MYKCQKIEKNLQKDTVDVLHFESPGASFRR